LHTGHLLAYYCIKTVPGIKVAIHPSEQGKGLNAYILRMLEGNTILKIHPCAAHLRVYKVESFHMTLTVLCKGIISKD